jgi:hypothetical protein
MLQGFQICQHPCKNDLTQAGSTHTKISARSWHLCELKPMVCSLISAYFMSATRFPKSKKIYICLWDDLCKVMLQTWNRGVLPMSQTSSQSPRHRLAVSQPKSVLRSHDFSNLYKIAASPGRAVTITTIGGADMHASEHTSAHVSEMISQTWARRHEVVCVLPALGYSALELFKWYNIDEQSPASWLPNPGLKFLWTESTYQSVVRQRLTDHLFDPDLMIRPQISDEHFPISIFGVVVRIKGLSSFVCTGRHYRKKTKTLLWV